MPSVQTANGLADTHACVQPQADDHEPITSITQPGALEQTPGFWYPREVHVLEAFLDTPGIGLEKPVLKPPTHPIAVTYYYGSLAWPASPQQ